MKRKVKNKLQKWTVFSCVQRDVQSINQTKIDKRRPRTGFREGQTFLDIHSINHGPTKPHFSVGRERGDGPEEQQACHFRYTSNLPSRNGTSQDIWLNIRIQMWVKDSSHTCYRPYLCMNFTVVQRWRYNMPFRHLQGVELRKCALPKHWYPLTSLHDVMSQNIAL
jgi:hypothetical protein